LVFPKSNPHSPQNLSPGRFSELHWGQSSISFVPHSRQNLRVSGFSIWHSGHFIQRPPENLKKRRSVVKENGLALLEGKYSEDVPLCQFCRNPYKLWPVSAFEKFSMLAISSNIQKFELTNETVEKVTNHKVTTTSVWSPRFSK